MRIHQSGLDDSESILRIDAQNLAHPGELDHDAAINRERAPGKPRARAAGRKAHVFCGQKFEDFRGLFG